MTAARIWRRLLPTRLEILEQPSGRQGWGETPVCPCHQPRLPLFLGPSAEGALQTRCWSAEPWGGCPRGRVPAPGFVLEEENLGHRSSLGTSTFDAAKGNKLTWKKQEKGQQSVLKATGQWGEITQWLKQGYYRKGKYMDSGIMLTKKTRHLKVSRKEYI